MPFYSPSTLAHTKYSDQQTSPLDCQLCSWVGDVVGSRCSSLGKDGCPVGFLLGSGLVVWGRQEIAASECVGVGCYCPPWRVMRGGLASIMPEFWFSEMGGECSFPLSPGVLRI